MISRCGENNGRTPREGSSAARIDTITNIEIKKTIPATFCHIFSALFGYTVRNLGSMSYKQVEQGLLYYDAINGGHVVLFFAAN